MMENKNAPVGAPEKKQCKGNTNCATGQIERSYFEQRIYDELGLKPEDNTIRLTRYWDGADRELTADYPLFEEDKDGNIRILIYTIDRRTITYSNKVKGKDYYDRSELFSITRLKTPETYTDKDGKQQVRKYVLPKGAGTHPYFPKSLTEKYLAGTQVHTLILTEGAFKATKGCLCGLDVVGLSSITHIKDKDTQAMYADVVKLIRKCKVENIIILFDGDCRNISTKALEAGQDIATRPRTFFNQVKECRRLLEAENKNMYFATIRIDELNGCPKGLDDLLLSEKETVMVVNDIINVSRPCKYVEKLDITQSFQLRKLFQWFGLSNVEQFYDRHQAIIGEREFVFDGTKYRLEIKNGKPELTVIIPKEAKDYIRVSNDYWKFVKVPNKYGQDEKQLQSRKRSTIVEDHGKGIFEFIPKFEAFCNVPSHTEYRAIINNCYNRYAEFTHEPEEGECVATLEFIRHIFGEQFELGLDYVQLLYQQPQQILPILCLVSRENNTGKSTFIKWLKALFADNCAVVGNQDFANDFNGYWASKLIIACEESFLDKKPIIERIKALSTGDKISLNMKGKDQMEISFFGKFVLASNNEENFIIASKEDIRYWVRKISVPATDRVNLLDEMIQEIPQFLYFLNTRKLSTERSSRMWFSPTAIRTEALEKLIEQNTPAVIKRLKDELRQYFIDFPEEHELRLPSKMVAEYVLEKSNFEPHYIIMSCRQYLGVDLAKKADGSQIIERCKWQRKYWNDDSGVPSISPMRGHGQPLVFPREKFFTPAELSELENLAKVVY